MLSSRYGGPWPYFIVAYTWSWMFWIPAALSGRAMGQSPLPLLIALGGLGPLVAAVALTYLVEGGEGGVAYWRRLIEAGRIGAGWYAVILLGVPIITGLAGLLAALTGGQAPHLEARFGPNLLSILPFIVFTLFFGPLPEELGWRGYALDRLQQRYGALVSSLILGALWAAWHLPLFFVEGSYQRGLGLGSFKFWSYMGNIVLQSVVMTWIYNNNRRSILSAVLFHFVVNFTGELLVLPGGADLYQTVLWALAALGVTLLWGPRTLTRGSA